VTAPRRGDVWQATLDPTVGHEQAGFRPVLVLSEDAFNASPAGLVTILPITSKARVLRTRVTISPPDGGLKLTSYVVCEQPRTISSRRLVKRVGAVARPTLAAVEDIVRVLLGL
jgi:mRNA interferase MazF